MMNARKNLGLLLWALFFTLPAAAQLGEERHNFAVGINGGMNLSSVSFQPRIKQGMLKGMNIGGTLRYTSEKYFGMICGLQLEANYSQRGWKEKIEDGSDNTYSRTMNYVEVPFMAHLAFGKDALNRGVKFFVNLGPQFGLFLNDEEKMSDNWDISGRNVSEQYGKEPEKRFDYGIIGGLGLEVSTGIGHFLLEGRYYYGLADFYNNSKRDYFERSAHTIIGVKMTYLFDITK